MKELKTAIVLFNLGGPDKPEAIRPFLFNLFNDKAIISLPQPFRSMLAWLISKKREKTAQEIYKELGGKSPIEEITRSQADELEKELSYIGDFKVFVAMRYWKPFAAEAVEQIKNYGADQIILLPLYPQFSTATSESSIDDFIKSAKKLGLNLNFQQKKWFNFKKDQKNDENKIQLKTVCCYFQDEDFILSHAKLLKQKILESGLSLNEFRILFSAHGLPQKIIDGGDPYAYQVEKTAQKVLQKLEDLLRVDGSYGGDLEGKIDAKVCYQSKVGPLKWTSPSLDQEIRRVALDGKNPIITPIAFVSEHSETLVELDIEYKELADELKIEKYIRVPALNIDGHFIRSLTKICSKLARKDEDGVFAAERQERDCPKGFKRCVNKGSCAS